MEVRTSELDSNCVLVSCIKPSGKGCQRPDDIFFRHMCDGALKITGCGGIAGAHRGDMRLCMRVMCVHLIP